MLALFTVSTRSIISRYLYSVHLNPKQHAKPNPRQQQILDLITDWIDQNGVPPTRTEICDHFGFKSPTAADDHLKALARKEVIELVPGSSRGIRLLHSPEEGIPVVGRVAAREPIMSEQHIEEHYTVDPDLFSPNADYLLRVNGMSMRDAGILDGDLLVVHATPVAEKKQIVVARVDDEVTVKRFTQRGNIVTLLPENPDFDPIRIDVRKQALHIEGICVGVIRQENT